MSQISDGFSPVALADVRVARERIVNEIVRTPLVISEAASRRAHRCTSNWRICNARAPSKFAAP